MDVLVKFPNKNAANGFCNAMGFADRAQTHSGDGLDMHEIGVHTTVVPGPTPEDPPVVTTHDGWWILFRVPDGFRIPLDKIGQGQVRRRSDQIPEGGWPDEPEVPNHAFL